MELKAMCHYIFIVMLGFRVKCGASLIFFSIAISFLILKLAVIIRIALIFLIELKI